MCACVRVCVEQMERWEAGAKGQQWLTGRQRWHKRLQSHTVCHVDGVRGAERGPERKRPFQMVPRGHLRRQTEPRLSFPPPACPFVALETMADSAYAIAVFLSFYPLFFYPLTLSVFTSIHPPIDCWHYPAPILISSQTNSHSTSLLLC